MAWRQQPCFSALDAGCVLRHAQIKEFSEPQDKAADTASKDQTGAPAAAGAGGQAPAITKAALDLPAVEVIPHALAKLEKPADEMYTVGAGGGMTGAFAGWMRGLVYGAHVGRPWAAINYWAPLSRHQHQVTEGVSAHRGSLVWRLGGEAVPCALPVMCLVSSVSSTCVARGARMHAYVLVGVLRAADERLLKSKQP